MSQTAEEENTAPQQDNKPEGAGPSAEERVAELEAQVAELKNEALRYLADAENTRRRAAKEKEDTSKYAVSKFARDLLEVADNLSRALSAVPAELRDNAALKNLLIGVDATGQQMNAVFERAGIQKVDPSGKLFDPNLHQVVSEVENTDVPAGTVTQVLQVGYVIHDRLLRAAMVVVAKGGPVAHNVNKTV